MIRRHKPGLRLRQFALSDRERRKFMKLDPPGDVHLREQEDRLFDAWKTEWRVRESYRDQTFLPDGAMPKFSQEAFRLVFVGKEGNDPEEKWSKDECGDLRTAWCWGYAQGYTWRRLASWASLILENRSFEEASRMSEESTRSVLQRIAFMNLKKNPGGSSSTYDDISRAATDDQSFLCRQLTLYRPTLVICCGTLVFSSLEQIFGFEKKARTLLLKDDDGDEFYSQELFGGAKLVDFWHPQARRIAEIDFGKLQRVMNHVRNEMLRPSQGRS